MSGLNEPATGERTQTTGSGDVTQQEHSKREPGGDQKGHVGPGQVHGKRFNGSKAWWSVGELQHQGITHQSVGLSLGEEETWDLSDSLADLYQAVTRKEQKAATRVKGHNRTGSGGGNGRVDSDNKLDIKRWLDDDTSNGFIRVFQSDTDPNARLFPCTLYTPAQKICLQLGIPGNALHVQLSGDVIRRMEPFDCPLAIQNEYLAGIGYTDVRYIQEAGPKEDLTFLVRFYAGKPLSLSDYTYSRNQLTTYAYIRKGKLIHQWVRRQCTVSGTRLLIYREKGAEPTVVQLARGFVEEVNIKGQSLVLKITTTHQGERSMYMSFVSPEDYNKWLKKIKKATAKLPSKADLSNCHLEFIPETVFVNTELEILILRHNALRERPIEEDIYTIGWLDDLPRFTALRSLNLADNQLPSFPVSLCRIRSLVELNLASNKLEDIPAQISELVNLQVLHLHNNKLSSLPDEIAQMKNLTVVVLAFNQFTAIPSILLQPKQSNFLVDSIIMAGNQISRLHADQLVHMGQIKKIDLRLNQLQLMPTEMARFQSIEHVTHMDIRENQVTDLDIRAIRYLEYLNCQDNNMRSLQLNGTSLKNIYAAHNNLQTLSINPKPEWLVTMNVSYNKLIELPAWLSDCFFLVELDVSHNHLKSLPERLFTDAKKLKIVKANHNRITDLPDKTGSEMLEELHLQHNQIRHLSTELFIKAHSPYAGKKFNLTCLSHNQLGGGGDKAVLGFGMLPPIIIFCYPCVAHRLRYLNMTKNKLSDLPPPNKNDSYNKLQELYLSFNHLGNQCLHKICCFPRLRVLHLARNKLTVIEETDFEKLEQLTELNVSSNNLTYLPAALGRHPKLQVLRANCNLLQELPNFKNSSGLKVLEVSSNHLVKVNMANLMHSQVASLDITANPSIEVKSQDVQTALSSKKLSMVDMRGQNRSTEDLRLQGDVNGDQIWQTGLSKTSGIRNKLSVTAINKPHFNDNGEALFAIFDGGRNEVVANQLCDIIPIVLKEERSKSRKPEVYLKYCLLSAHRNLKQQGQKLGAAAVVAHIHKDDKNSHVLSVGNVGDAQVVLCRQRKAYLLSRPFLVAEDVEDKKRIVKSGGIITEDGRVSGVTYNTRLLGCSYLYPHVIPEPHVSSTVLTTEDTLLIVANQGLWQYVTYDEAVHEVKDVPDPVVAAKRLQDLAQGYGSRENIAVLVVRLMMSEAERARIKDLMRIQRKGQKELLKALNNRPSDILQFRDGVPKVQELSGVVIDKSGHAKKNRSGRKNLLDSESIKSSPSAEEVRVPSPQDPVHVDILNTVSQKRHNSHQHLAQTMSDSVSVLKQDDRHLYRKKSSYSSKDNLSKRNPMDGSAASRDSTPKLDHLRDGPASGNLTSQIKTTKADGHVDFIDGSALLMANAKTHNNSLVTNVEGKEGDSYKMMLSESLGRNADDQIPDEEDTSFYGNDAENFPDDFDPFEDPYDKHSQNGGFSVSPTESISSIDTRVHNEVDDIFRLRHLSKTGPDELNHSRYTGVSKSGFSDAGRIHVRPISPDSLISLDEFVKPAVSMSNIDRDALLFHQMQLARAQAHVGGGSTASLDSIQSAPLHASRRDIFPAARTSSHSIEVLVNIGEEESGTDSMKRGRVEWGSSLSGFTSGASTVTSSKIANLDSSSDAPSFILENPLDVSGNMDRAKLLLQDHLIQAASVKPYRDKDVVSKEQEDNDTLIGDDDIGNLNDVCSDEEMEGDDVGLEQAVINENEREPNWGQRSDEFSEQYDSSGSDESIGNVSLEDGYSAIEFSKPNNKRGSVSMLNVLDIDYEGYPQNNLRLKHASRNENSKFLAVGDRDRAPAGKAGLVKKVTKGKKVGDYEDIDKVRSEYSLTGEEQNFSDGYEVLSKYSQVKVTQTVSGKAEAKISTPSEEDIDELYAKVNKFKMKKTFEKYSDDGSQNPVGEPGIKSDRYPDEMLGEQDSVIILTSEGGGEEIQIPSSSRAPQHLLNSVHKFKHVPVLAQNQNQRNRTPINTPPMFRRIPPNAFGPSQSSPTSSSSSVLSISPIPTCNTPGLFVNSNSQTVTSSLKPDFHISKSFMSTGTHSSAVLTGDPVYNRNVTPPPSEAPPPLPPKPPFLKSFDGQSSSKTFVSPENSGNGGPPSMVPPPFPPRRNPSAPPTSRKTSPKPVPKKRQSLMKQGVNDGYIDVSVLSAQDVYLDSPKTNVSPYSSPMSSPYSSSVNMSHPASSKLSTQRSIIITYL
ncbi:unnamed protein product [Lymnaea stagnalis]|uniref:PPM-type phosphatase domain-containing protein n=1 Tax=Lymnaea stagnalis TaxID=6523 RepID=A0AAV2I8E6_LYMST